MGPQWHQQQQMRLCGCGAALSWTLHGGGSGKKPARRKAASSTKAFVKAPLSTCFLFLFFFFTFLIKSCLPFFSYAFFPSSCLRGGQGSLDLSPGRVPHLHHTCTHSLSGFFPLSLLIKTLVSKQPPRAACPGPPFTMTFGQKLLLQCGVEEGAWGPQRQIIADLFSVRKKATRPW